jgi:hypothetical protein
VPVQTSMELNPHLLSVLRPDSKRKHVSASTRYTQDVLSCVG